MAFCFCIRHNRSAIVALLHFTNVRFQDLLTRVLFKPIPNINLGFLLDCQCAKAQPFSVTSVDCISFSSSASVNFSLTTAEFSQNCMSFSQNTIEIFGYHQWLIAIEILGGGFTFKATSTHTQMTIGAEIDTVCSSIASARAKAKATVEWANTLEWGQDAIYE
jgi:hypothetical protein